MIRFAIAAALVANQVSALGFAPCHVCGEGSSVTNRWNFFYNPDSFNWVNCYDFERAALFGLISSEDCENASAMAAACCGEQNADPIPESVDLAPLWPAFPICAICEKPLSVVRPDNEVTALGATTTCAALSYAGSKGFIDDADCPSVAPIVTQDCCVQTQEPTNSPSKAPSASPSTSPSTVPSKAPSAAPSNTPTASPSESPSKSPSALPSASPSKSPTTTPSISPSGLPSSEPSKIPTTTPSSEPSVNPSSSPSVHPSKAPSDVPSGVPSTTPTAPPSKSPSNSPTTVPSKAPSTSPSTNPSGSPSGTPSKSPTSTPSLNPSTTPSSLPSLSPSSDPTHTPSKAPSSTPSIAPSAMPSYTPSSKPSGSPTAVPSLSPSGGPSYEPSNSPSGGPSEMPSDEPSLVPSDSPSGGPSDVPSDSPSGGPSDVPSDSPSAFPTAVPSASPSLVPSDAPSGGPSSVPSDHPSIAPSDSPSGGPSSVPSDHPSIAPSGAPSGGPSSFPSDLPSIVPSKAPSIMPSDEPSSNPSGGPSSEPSGMPSWEPSVTPSIAHSGRPSDIPSDIPSGVPSGEPSGGPSSYPSGVPSGGPSGGPSSNPSGVPSGGPSSYPSGVPSGGPSGGPSGYPSGSPSGGPSGFPSSNPSGGPSGGPSSIPSSDPSAIPSDVETFPPIPIARTSPPLISVGDFCYEVVGDQCILCRPFQSPDYCPVDESFALLVQARKDAYREADFDLEDYWFPYLDDKVGAYVFTASSDVLTPQMYCCLTDASQLQDCLDNDVPSSATGYVIKATHFHTSQGVYVLRKDPPSTNLYEVLRGEHLALSDIIAELSVLGDTKIIVEELIGNGELDAEFKLHAFPGEVVAIDVIDRRTQGCDCIAVVDPAWNRLDQFGCFVPSGIENSNADGSCSAIDFQTGSMSPGPVKKNLNLCGPDIPRPEQCIINDMVAIAEALSLQIGVYMRIDVFVSNGQVYVQEYSPNPINGLRHCVAKEEDDCIDSCLLGRKWKGAGLPYGGMATSVPSLLNDYTDKSASDQCAISSSVTINSSFTSSCIA